LAQEKIEDAVSGTDTLLRPFILCSEFCLSDLNARALQLVGGLKRDGDEAVGRYGRSRLESVSFGHQPTNDEGGGAA
jgi:hypothetical protein